VARLVRIAVVGAGLFGCTAAVRLARAGHEVNLFERNADILRGATAASCNRVHLGYHYPRSDDTARTAIADAPLFVEEFADAIDFGASQHYVIAGGGLITRDQFTDFADKLDLPYAECEETLVRTATTEGVFAVPETLVNVNRLRRKLATQLAAANVNVRVWSAGTPDMPGHDVTVMTTYGNDFPRPLQYEVTEVAIVKLDDAYVGSSFVVLDGPFGCVDPLPGTNLHLLYDVTHSVHHRNVGTFAVVPPNLIPLVDSGPVITPHTRVTRMVGTLATYLRDLGGFVYVGSVFTVRAVLPDVDDTDERPTLVTWSGNTVHVLSGKLSSAVATAERVVKEVS
jgi:hypothetical protein